MPDSATSRIASIATHILSVALRQSIHLDYANQLRNRSDICRFYVLDGLSTAPDSVVVKCLSASDSHSAAPSELVRLKWLFCNEWAGLALLQQLIDDPPLAPRFYGGDLATRTLVIEDLGTSPTLWGLLQAHNSQRATTQLVALATTFGRMHAQTIGQQPRFNQIRDALAPSQPPTDFSDYEWIRPTVEITAATLGVRLLPAIEQDLARLKRILSEPDAFWVYTQGDPSPGNCLFVAPSMRLLDFGVGAYRHAFVDFPPPWCWQQIPRSVMHQMIDAYQMTLAEGCAAAADPRRFAYGLVEGCAYWSLTLLKDWPLAEVAANAGMRRSLVHVLKSLVELSQQTAYLETLGAMIAAVVEAIDRRWPSDRSQLAYYPAFQECE
jgi:hypothetical protein